MGKLRTTVAALAAAAILSGAGPAVAAQSGGAVSYTFNDVIIDGTSYIITGGQVKDKGGLKPYCNYYRQLPGVLVVEGYYRDSVPLADTSSDAVKTYCVNHFVDRTN